MKFAIELQNNKQLDKFIQLVNDFEKANPDINIKKININFKYNMRSSGEYHDNKPNSIDINPNRCDKTGDYSFFLICVHEFSHLLDKKFKMIKPFEEEFKNQYLFLTSYAKKTKEVVEELAEIISLFLRNPFFLKLISEKHYEFIKKFFYSPTECSKQNFLTQYEKYSPRYKQHIMNKHGIVIKRNSNIYKNKLLIG